MESAQSGPAICRRGGIPQTSADVVRRVRRVVQAAQANAFGRVLSTYGWRTYVIPALAVLTVILLVLTFRDGGKPAQPESPADLTARNTNINEATTAIGAPSEQVDPDAMPAGVLPSGGSFTAQGEGISPGQRTW